MIVAPDTPRLEDPVEATVLVKVTGLKLAKLTCDPPDSKSSTIHSAFCPPRAAEEEGAETDVLTLLPVLSFVKTTVPVVEEVAVTVTEMVLPAEMVIPEKSMAKLGNHSNQASYETLPPEMVKSIPDCRMAFWNVSPSMPTQADAEYEPELDEPFGTEGVGALNEPETLVNFWPAGGDVMTAPAQLELNWTWETLDGLSTRDELGSNVLPRRASRAATR